MVPTTNNPGKILNEFFGYDNFKNGQLEIIEAVINLNNVLVVLPTGAGKSICYQIPALISENFSIVISPLIALMKDQVDALNSRKEIAAFINSTMSYSETEQVLNKIALGSIKILYLAPERIENLKFAERIKELRPKNIFIDEAHCISEWGHNFRPSYLRIKDFIDHTGVKKVSAFTATATPEVREDIVSQLNFKEPKIFVRGFERENLHLRVIHTKKKKEKCYELLQEIKGPAIIYTSSRKKAEEAAEYLNIKGIKCNYYHAGLTAPERRRIQEEFIYGNTEIIAATNAFGMGIDKSDIRLIIHFNTPGSIESYYQEIGRAGRDSKESFCYLLHDEADIRIQNFFITNSHPHKEHIQKIYKAVCDYNRIAVGSTTDKELVVDKDYIIKYIGAEISSGLLYSALKYLENSGYFRRVSEFDKKDSLQILVSKDELRQLVQNPSYQEIANVVISLLREFGSVIFNSPMKISASYLANKFSIPAQSFVDSLNILDNMGVIAFQQAITKETVLLTAPRVDADKLVLNYKLINESYLNLQHKLDKMTEFVFTNECRFRNILTYFGENVSDYKCAKCDNCTSTGKLKDSSTAYLSEIIIETLEEAKEDLPENFLVNLLRGEKVKDSAALFQHFGACKKFTTAEIKGVMSVQVSKGKIIKRAGKRNYLGLPMADDVKSEKIDSTDDADLKTQSYDNELYLFNQLRQVRKKAAERFLQSGYLICPDNVLREVARIQPRNKFELLNIKGFNSRMFNKIGNDFLEIIDSYKPVEIRKTATKNRQGLPSNIIE
ncbi:MAG: ATP-dependent DNA helicase, partial [Ignavibacteria bacterium]|nr:ATP-dependent DNA helicase [Ignavibacteria bacterium]